MPCIAHRVEISLDQRRAFAHPAGRLALLTLRRRRAFLLLRPPESFVGSLFGRARRV